MQQAGELAQLAGREADGLKVAEGTVFIDCHAPEDIFKIVFAAGPAVVDGRLLIRGKQNLYCFGTR